MRRVSSHAVSWWSRLPGCCGFRGVFWVRRDFVFFFPVLFFFERTRPAASMRPPCPIYLSPSIKNRLPFACRAKKPLHPGVRTGCHYLISLPVCVFVCVTFVVFTDCECCTRPISTNSGSMEAAECGQTSGACFVTCHFAVVAVAVLLWLSWCVFGTAGFFLVFQVCGRHL